MGLTAVIKTIQVQKTTIRYEIPAMIGITVFLVLAGLRDNVVNRVEGCMLLLCMVGYLLYLLRMAKAGADVVETAEIEENKPIPKLILLVVIGMGLIVWGSDVAVDAATNIARIFSLSERLIGLTIVALGTSLPELVTSVTAALKGNSDIAVGNIVGSNLFNILFVVGLTAVITPVVYHSSFLVDSITAIAAAVQKLS